jgi:hypothetical protein
VSAAGTLTARIVKLMEISANPELAPMPKTPRNSHHQAKLRPGQNSLVLPFFIITCRCLTHVMIPFSLLLSAFCAGGNYYDPCVPIYYSYASMRVCEYVSDELLY